MKNDFNVFCTLFDSNYLDKALVMIDSLKKTTDYFLLYVLPMDDLCKKILIDLNIENVIIIDFSDFIFKENLQEIRNNRTTIEFYYTCTSHLLEYVLVYMKRTICTYIDADLLFYSNPSVVVSEIGNNDALIIKHGFENNLIDKEREKTSGIFCVQFNTFKNTRIGMELLRWWKNKCRDYCGYNNDNFGDQKYLDEWNDNKNVRIVSNNGAGVAPWNIHQFSLVENKRDVILIKKKNNRNIFPLVFYHFENINYYDINHAKINVFIQYLFNDKKLIDLLYIDYFKKTNVMKNFITNKYNFTPLIISHPANSITPDPNIKKSLVSVVLNLRNRIVGKINCRFDYYNVKSDFT